MVCGVDPGVAGAIAVVDLTPDGAAAIISVYDMPVDKVERGGHTRSSVNRFQLLGVFQRYTGVAVITERPDFRPMRTTNKRTGVDEFRQVGAAGMGSFGISYGVVLMGTTACGMPLTEISPGAWKRAMGVKGDKDDSRRRAMELFPAWSGLFQRKKDDGRAEATLLALYHAQRLRGETNGRAI